MAIRLIFFLLMALSSTSVTAQDFRSARLKRAAEVVGIASQTASILPDTTVGLRAIDGRTVIVRTDHSGVIEHVGLPLFPTVMRLLQPSPVYDFLEYAVLNKHYRVDPNQLYLSKVVFQKGSWQSLAADDLSCCECAITNQDDRLYIVSWQRDGIEVAAVGVPVDYELLTNDTRRNMERDLIRHLQAYRLPRVPRQLQTVTLDKLSVFGTTGLFVLQGKFHILPELNQNIYYRLVHNDSSEGGVIPLVVVDEERPAETFSNLMMDSSGGVPDVLMHLDIHFSDYRRQQVDVPLPLLRDFLIRQGSELYFACSSADSLMLRGVLFVHNAASGYNHLLSVRLPVSQLGVIQPEATADVYLYIPSIDKSNLYGTMPETKSGAIISH